MPEINATGVRKIDDPDHRVGAYAAAGALTVGFAAWVYCSGGLGTVNTPQYAYAMSVILAVGVTAPALTQSGTFAGYR